MKTPKEVCQTYVDTIGVGKATAPIPQMFLLGIMAGAFIAFAGIASTVAGVAVPSAAKLVGASVFPGGLAMVLLAGSELFTGNCLLILPLLSKKISFSAMIRNWVVVYAGNFVGSLIVASLVVYGHSLNCLDGVAVAAIKTAVAKTSLPFMDALFRGILCNVLVCIAVWISFSATDVVGKVAGIFFPVMMFVLCVFEHSVANMYFISAGMFASALPEYAAIAANISLDGFLFGNLLPVTIGNIIGGSLFVGAVYWRCYATEK